jgi:hypothetical protein
MADWLMSHQSPSTTDFPWDISLNEFRRGFLKLPWKNSWALPQKPSREFLDRPVND